MSRYRTEYKDSISAPFSSTIYIEFVIDAQTGEHVGELTRWEYELAGEKIARGEWTPYPRKEDARPVTEPAADLRDEEQADDDRDDKPCNDEGDSSGTPTPGSGADGWSVPRGGSGPPFNNSEFRHAMFASGMLAVCCLNEATGWIFLRQPPQTVVSEVGLKFTILYAAAVMVWGTVVVPVALALTAVPLSLFVRRGARVEHAPAQRWRVIAIWSVALYLGWKILNISHLKYEFLPI